MNRNIHNINGAVGIASIPSDDPIAPFSFIRLIHKTLIIMAALDYWKKGRYVPASRAS